MGQQPVSKARRDARRGARWEPRREARRRDTYRGDDRRQRIEQDRTTDRTWIIGGIALCALLVTISWLANDGELQSLGIAVRATGLILTAALIAAGLLYWRATGEAAGYLVATAGWLAGLGLVAEVVRPEATIGWYVLCAMPFLLAAGWVGRAIVGPTIDTRRGPWQQIGVATVTLVVSWGTVSGLAAAFDVPLRTTTVVLHVVAAAAWGAVALLGVLRAVRGTSVLRSWMTWMALCLSLAAGVYLLRYVQTDTWAPIGDALRLSGLAIGTLGAGVALARRAITRRDALYEETVRHQHEHRQHDQSERERDHEIRTALLAIEGATLTLQQHRDHLDDTQQAALNGALRAGMDHLRALTIAADDEVARPVLDVVDDHLALARGRGLTVRRWGPDHLDVEVEARVLGQVLDNLLTNAERHGGRDGPVTIDVAVAQLGDDEVAVTVRDDGPGIPENELQGVFEPGERLGAGAPGEGLGLPVARRLVRAHGGELEALPSEDGAHLEVRLPRAGRHGSASQRADEPQHLVEVGELADGGEPDPDLSPAPGRPPFVQYHRQLGSRLRRRARHHREVEQLVGDRVAQHEGDVGHLVDERAETVADQRRSR